VQVRSVGVLDYGGLRKQPSLCSEPGTAPSMAGAALDYLSSAAVTDLGGAACGTYVACL